VTLRARDRGNRGAGRACRRGIRQGREDGWGRGGLALHAAAFVVLAAPCMTAGRRSSSRGQMGHDGQLTLRTYGHVIEELEDGRVPAEDTIRAARAGRSVIGVSRRPTSCAGCRPPLRACSARWRACWVRADAILNRARKAIHHHARERKPHGCSARARAPASWSGCAGHRRLWARSRATSDQNSSGPRGGRALRVSR